jgi:hypothetical protein
LRAYRYFSRASRDPQDKKFFQITVRSHRAEYFFTLTARPPVYSACPFTARPALFRAPPLGGFPGPLGIARGKGPRGPSRPSTDGEPPEPSAREFSADDMPGKPRAARRLDGRILRTGCHATRVGGAAGRGEPSGTAGEDPDGAPGAIVAEGRSIGHVPQAQSSRGFRLPLPVPPSEGRAKSPTGQCRQLKARDVR